MHGEHKVASTTVQLSMEVTDEHVGPMGGLELTCLSTIPAYHGEDHEYADKRQHSTTVDVLMPQTAESTSSDQSSRLSSWSFMSIGCLMLLVRLASRHMNLFSYD